MNAKQNEIKTHKVKHYGKWIVPKKKFMIVHQFKDEKIPTATDNIKDVTCTECLKIIESEENEYTN